MNVTSIPLHNSALGPELSAAPATTAVPQVKRYYPNTTFTETYAAVRTDGTQRLQNAAQDRVLALFEARNIEVAKSRHKVAESAYNSVKQQLTEFRKVLKLNEVSADDFRELAPLNLDEYPTYEGKLLQLNQHEELLKAQTRILSAEFLRLERALQEAEAAEGIARAAERQAEGVTTVSAPAPRVSVSQTRVSVNRPAEERKHYYIPFVAFITGWAVGQTSTHALILAIFIGSFARSLFHHS